jgi:catechol 2,3-dioxygenase-like lactoylglutathione lyase family enzyme
MPLEAASRVISGKLSADDPYRPVVSRRKLMQIEAIEHVQLAMPKGQEDDARLFYRDSLGLSEVPKPPELAKRGGAWFELGTVRVHLGVEQDFRPARKAHPAFLVSGIDDLASRLNEAGYEVTIDNDLPGFRRFYTSDPFGNRLEFMQAE